MQTKSKQINFLAVLLCITLASAWAGETKKCDKSMKCEKMLKGIIHFSDNDVRFATKDQGVIFIDPVSGPEDSTVIKSGLFKPDLILITHPHGDHFQPDVLKAYIKTNPDVVLAGPAQVVELAIKAGIDNMKTVEPNQKYGLAGVKVKTLPAYFSKGDSHPKENGWVGYVLMLNGLTYYITGDTEPVPEMADLKVDVLMPLLYGCGGNIDQAIKMSKLTKAALVVPVHTGGQKEVIKKFVSRLPDDVHSACYLGAKLKVVK